MELLEVMQSVRLLLAKPANWTQGFNARDKNGRAVGWNHPAACRWDIEGALRHCGGDNQKNFWKEFRPIAVTMIGKDRNLFDWEYKPSRKHREVMSLLDSVIDEIRWRDGPADDRHLEYAHEDC